MIQPLSSQEIGRFRSAVSRGLGLRFEDDRLAFLADVLRCRLTAVGQHPTAYLSRLETEVPSVELAALARRLTVAETHFFRNSAQFRAFAQTALPDRVASQAGTRSVRILSAGCASGEEAYSIAILIRESLDPAWNASVLGVDVNPEMVRTASRGRYSAWALRETPADIRRRWFTPEGGDFVVDEGLRTKVSFEERNLARDDPRFWQTSAYDIVFFRNVLMYFTKEHAKAVMARISCALKPAGYLFLGHAETLRGISDDFDLKHTHETFYYQRKDGVPLPERPPLAPLTSRGLVPVETRPRPPHPVAPLGSGPSPLTSAVGWSLGVALNLLRQERFAEALDMTDRAPLEFGRDGDLLLLRAVLFTHRRRLAEAEGACHQLLDVDKLSAGAHYVLALCRDAAQDRTGAVSHSETAIRLDPSFAMAHLHLGLLARRLGDAAAAQRALARAVLLLQHEHGKRLLLFGGGFEREALIALCRAELLGCGGWPSVPARPA